MSDVRPRIVLTCGVATWRGAGEPPPPGRKRSLRANLRVEYIRGVEAAGGAPVLLADSPDPEVARAVVSGADGLLLTGGVDVDPAAYGQPVHPETQIASADRERTERAAIQAALAAGVPVLGICRGIQVLNVVLGGTLIQHLPAHLGVPADFEPDGPPGPVVNHKGHDHGVRVAPGSMLARLWPVEGLVVNSRHHQAVDEVAASLRPVAWAADGVVEAVESADGKCVLAVQCHPEDGIDRPEFLALFRWLVTAAR